MKKQQQMLSILLVLFVLDGKLFTIEAGTTQTTITTTTSNVVYFQASNSKNQLGGPYATPVTYNSIDGLNGYTLYNNVSSPSRNGEGEVHIWQRREGQDKPNSNIIQTVKRGTTSVLIYQTVVQVPVGRVASLAFLAFTDNQCSSLGLIATAPENEPVAPGIRNSRIQLGDATILYAALSSSETQLGGMSSKAITLNTIGGNNAIDITTIGNDGTFSYNQSGLYFAIACAQVGSVNDSNASGEVHLWMRLNGKDLPNSNTIQTIRHGNTAVLLSQTIIRLATNDKLKLLFSTTNKKLGVIALTPPNEPTVSSMVFSTFHLDSKDHSVAYAQLSSSKTQWGCLTPKGVQLNNDDGSKHIINNNGIIEFQQSGTYFLLAAAQVGSCGEKGIGDLHLWMRLNAQDLANSNTIQTVNGDTAILISQAAVKIQAGDKLQLMFSTDVTRGTLGLVASQPIGEPTVPSMIFTAFKSTF